ncbi:MAG: (2Fe-2S) ferredoxin domain-containing protein [Magnetococcales bacterium]|nr:(2Fe-2S) ferredoxin domain-containing protein [Magnetococcales bacterium]
MKPTLIICIHDRLSEQPSCAGRGSLKLKELLINALRTENIDITVKELSCFGDCTNGPNMRLAPGGPFFQHVNTDTIHGVVEAARVFLLQSDDETKK